jgi:hypothetical protein
MYFNGLRMYGVLWMWMRINREGKNRPRAAGSKSKNCPATARGAWGLGIRVNWVVLAFLVVRGKMGGIGW